jgi:RNA polymerase sigma factor (sigma-70 family)
MQKYSTTWSNWHMPDIVRALAEHERLVHWVVRRQWLGELAYAEAVQAGRIALWRAVRGYDPQRGYAFSSYAVPAIKHAIWREVAQAQPSPQEMLTPHPPQTAPEVDEIVERVLVWEALTRLLKCLPHRLQLVIVARYGLNGEAPQMVTDWASPVSVRINCTLRPCCGWLIRPTPWPCVVFWTATRWPTTGFICAACALGCGPGGEDDEQQYQRTERHWQTYRTP